MAASEDELLLPRLPELFETSKKLLEEVEVATEPSGSRTIQDKVSKGLDLLAKASGMLSELDLFSRNEDLEEIASTDLKYLMVPALQGALTMKQVNPSKRLDHLQRAREHFINFLTQCHCYHVAEFQLPQTKNNSAENNTASSSMTYPNLVAMASQRQAKIERYKQKKEVEHRLSALKSAVESGQADDERVREYHLLHLRRWIGISLEEIESIDQEIKILKEKDSPREESTSHSSLPEKPPMKPFILTRNKAQAKVFGAGYPSLATMTVSDWYDQHQKYGALPDRGIAKPTSDVQEGLRTLSVLQWIPVYVILGAIPILGIPYCLLFSSLWPFAVLSLIWLVCDWNTHSQDGRRSAWVRNWTLWKYFQSYFPVKLVKTHDLSPKHNYIIVSHPHGVLSFGAFVNFATEATGFSRIFPSITPFLATLEGIFWIPIVREYVMSMGICPVSELALKHKLTQKGSGNAVIVVVGGASEALLCRPGVSTLYLKNHKGFVKLALKTGAYLVPSYTFGENEVFNQETFREGTWLRFFQKNFQKIGKTILGLNFCTFHGRGLTRGSWGFLPFNHPITTVVGEPLPIPRINDPDKETVTRYFELYISALRKLFDQHKVEYGFSETQELTII